MSEQEKIIIVTGGTGGHIFPARSVAFDLAKRGFAVTIFADQNYQKYCQPNDPYNYVIISSSQIKNYRLFHLSNATLKITLGILQSFSRIFLIKPRIIIAFGGYATFPVLVASLILRKKIILHEQNAHLGKVNRIFAKYAVKIATSYEMTSGVKENYQSKLIFVGNPIRKEILALASNPYQLPDFNHKINNQKLLQANMGYNLLLASQFYNRTESDYSKEFFNILVIGGSGGSKIFSEILPRAFFNLRNELKDKIRIIQQCRREYLDSTFNQYRDFNLNIIIAGFFDNMAELIGKSHLVIARAGSSSIAEFTAAKRPMILVPFAKAADNHQQKNAEFVAKKGAAILIEEDKFTINNVSICVENLISKPNLLEKMSQSSFKCAVLDATDNLVKIIISQS